MKNLFGNRRRASDERRKGNTSPRPAHTHPLFSDALEHLPNARWAVACEAEFRSEHGSGLRGILHHDGGILRFTTWGGSERFAAAPMEFSWEQTEEGTFHIAAHGIHACFTRLAPLTSFVENPPSFAAAEDEPLADSLAAWMLTWAPTQPSPLASPM